MAASIRGHMGQIKLLRDGEVVDIVEIKSCDVKMDSSFSRTFYLGKAVGEGDQTVEGWSGSFECEVKNAAIDDFIDALVTNNLNGIGVSDYVLVMTENYSDGSSKSHMYTDCQFKMSRRQSGLNEKITKTIEFQAAARQAI